MKRFPFLLLLAVASLGCMLFERNLATPTPTVEPPVATVETATPSEAEKLEACLDRIKTALQKRPFDSPGSDIYEAADARFNLVIYRVEGDEITDPQILYAPSEYREYQEDTAFHQRIWDFYVAIIPAGAREPVSDFVIYSDGARGSTGAWVRPAAKDPTHWQVGFDVADVVNPLFLTDAIIHETAHLLTLNASQLPVDENYYYFNGVRNIPDCSQLVVGGGCSLPDSYINKFHRRFWQDIHLEWWKKEQEAAREANRRDYLKVMEQFYEAHRELFYDSYAATNIKEDMAESFTAFVLEPKPTGRSIPEQKILFYYEFPELALYRQQIIDGVCSYVP